MSILGMRVLVSTVVGLGLLASCESGNQTSKPIEPQPALTAASATPKPAPAGPRATEDWNDGQIKWMGFDEGLAAAKAERKPVCLVFYTQWCPHCRNYSAVFHDPRVVEQAKRFVMIRLDKDKNAPVSARFAPDGEYIPRTHFLSPDGVADDAIHAPRAKYKFFYDEQNPSALLEGMAEALRKLG